MPQVSFDFGVDFGEAGRVGWDARDVWVLVVEEAGAGTVAAEALVLGGS